MGLTNYLLGQQAARDAGPIDKNKPHTRTVRDYVTKKMVSVVAKNRGEQERWIQQNEAERQDMYSKM